MHSSDDDVSRQRSNQCFLKRRRNNIIQRRTTIFSNPFISNKQTSIHQSIWLKLKSILIHEQLNVYSLFSSDYLIPYSQLFLLTSILTSIEVDIQLVDPTLQFFQYLYSDLLHSKENSVTYINNDTIRNQSQTINKLLYNQKEKINEEQYDNKPILQIESFSLFVKNIHNYLDSKSIELLENYKSAPSYERFAQYMNYGIHIIHW